MQIFEFATTLISFKELFIDINDPELFIDYDDLIGKGGFGCVYK
jgi:hypothetical protein